MAAANYTNDVLKMCYGEMSDPGGIGTKRMTRLVSQVRSENSSCAAKCLSEFRQTRSDTFGV